MNKDIRIKELRMSGYVLLIGLIIALLLMAHYKNNFEDLEKELQFCQEELQTCQEEIEDWDLEVYCDWGGFFEQTLRIQLSTHEENHKWRDNIPEKCKVVEPWVVSWGELKK